MTDVRRTTPMRMCYDFVYFNIKWSMFMFMFKIYLECSDISNKQMFIIRNVVLFSQNKYLYRLSGINDLVACIFINKWMKKDWSHYYEWAWASYKHIAHMAPVDTHTNTYVYVYTRKSLLNYCAVMRKQRTRIILVEHMNRHRISLSVCTPIVHSIAEREKKNCLQ